MPITVQSKCGRSFPLKDDLAGKLVKCPECGEDIRVPGGAAPAAEGRFAGVDSAFQRRKFLLRQKHMAISEKYYVWDEAGKTILFVQRPAQLVKSCLAILAGVFSFILIMVAVVLLASAIDKKDVTPYIVIPAIFLGFGATLAVIILLAPKRHVFFYRDDNKAELLLKVEQDQKFAPIVATYTVCAPSGVVLAKLRKNYLYNIFRKRWQILTPQGGVISIVKEDSILLSLLRRVLGPAFGLLRTNFVFFKGETEQPIGEFNRKFTLLDRYVLDLSQDLESHIDPRIAVAAGVMLDTGERR